jgi:integrase
MISIKEFTDLYGNTSSRIAYRAGIFYFLEFIYGYKRKSKKSTKEDMEQFEKLAKQYFTEGRNYANDLQRFASNHDVPPKTIKLYMAAVKEYLLQNDIEISQKQARAIRNKMVKGGARTIEKDLDTDTLRKIINHMDIKGKALVLTLASSGMRIGEALSLNVKDIDMSSNPPIVTIKGRNTKTGDNRISFINKEAKEALVEWLKVRDSYLASSVNRNKGLVEAGIGNPKSESTDKLFPFTDNVSSQIWLNAITKAELLTRDGETNRIQLHIHQLRKFFRSQLALKCPVDIVEALMGHSGYLTEAYRRYSQKQMAEFYQNTEHLLYVSMPQDIQRIESEFKGQLDTNRKLVEEVVLENHELKREIQSMENKNSDLKLKVTKIENDFNEKVDALKEMYQTIMKNAMEISVSKNFDEAKKIK